MCHIDTIEISSYAQCRTSVIWKYKDGIRLFIGKIISGSF